MIRRTASGLGADPAKPKIGQIEFADKDINDANRIVLKAGVGPFLDRRQRERGAYCFRRPFPTRGDKAVRAQSIRGRMAMEGLYVPTGASWFPAPRSELLSFPAGKHDDHVDALGLVGQLLDTMTAGSKPEPPEPPKIRRDYVPWRSLEPFSWLAF